MTPVRLEPTAPRSRVKHSTTEPLRSLQLQGSYCKLGNFLEFYFREIILYQNGEITLLFTNIGKSCLSRDLLTMTNTSAIHENKICAKIFEFTVVTLH